MFHNIISFIYGFIMNILDDIYDMSIFQNYKLLFECIFLIISVYILFLRDDIGLILTLVCVIGSIVGILFANHVVNDPAWVISMILGVIGIFYHFDLIKKNMNEISKLNYKKILKFLIPSLTFVIALCLIEDKLVPENLSKRKIIDRIIQIILFVILIINISKLDKYLEHNNFLKKIILYSSYGWLGYVISSLLMMLYLISKK